MEDGAYITHKGIKKGYNREESTIMLVPNEKKKKEFKKDREIGLNYGTDHKESKLMNLGPK